jgi:glycosyltransferase involved in cell wall biosynthesis
MAKEIPSPALHGHILLVSHSPNLYGAEKSLLEIADYLHRHDYRISVVVPSAGMLSSALRTKGIPFIISRFETPSKKPWRFLRFVFLFPLRLVQLRRLMLQQHVQLVYANTFIAFNALLAARLAGRPAIAHVREVLSDYPCFIRRILIWIVSRFSYHIIANSHFTAEYFPARLSHKVTVVHNGIDCHEYQNAAAKANPSNVAEVAATDFVIGCISQLIPLKNLDLAIRTMACIARKPLPIKMLIIGNGPLRDRLERQTHELRLSNHIKFIPYQQNILDYITRFDIYFHTCPIEGFGRIFLEIMALAKPIVAPASGAALEIILDGETGFLVQGNDPEHYAERIEQLFADKALREEMGRKGRQRAEFHFALQDKMKQIQAIVKTLATQK